ncbi:MAG: hypothetical protein IJU79_01875 [Desulfovibrionaceae bacterium]|nr:hypothetical protein [Desulfovibrionaceae bacterium]
MNKAADQAKDPKPDAKKAKDTAAKEATPKWYEGRNKEIVIYYLIAVFFLEIIIGAAAFFYGVAHAEALVEGGPRMAKFPWIGWIISALLAPVGLLLLFQLSGWFFTRSSYLTADGTTKSQSQAVPKNVEQFYAVVSNAPVIVVLLGLMGLGAAVYFLDSALGTMRPYIPWILGSATTFLVICYVTRLYFLARHKRMEREYEYRMRVFEKTGVIIADKNMIPLTAQDIARAQSALLAGLNQGTNPNQKMLEQNTPEKKDDSEHPTATQEDIVDVDFTPQDPKKTS